MRAEKWQRSVLPKRAGGLGRRRGDARWHGMSEQRSREKALSKQCHRIRKRPPLVEPPTNTVAWPNTPPHCCSLIVRRRSGHA
ncbi:hypothetical protein MRX96_017204 [Rhipicephalus microplus]